MNSETEFNVMTLLIHLTPRVISKAYGIHFLNYLMSFSSLLSYIIEILYNFVFSSLKC
jgi:hypothetical protein